MIESGDSCNTFLPGMLTLLILLAQPASLPATDIYKWIDENGNVHYGDKPADNHAEQVYVTKVPISDDDLKQRITRQQRLLDVLEEERQKHKQSQGDQKAALEQRQSNCQAARKNLEIILASSYLYVETDDPYNPKVLSEEDRDSATTKAHKEVTEWCGNPGK